jgi:hypothetical protein
MADFRDLIAILPCNDLDASERFYNQLGFTRPDNRRPAPGEPDTYRMLSNGNTLYSCLMSFSAADLASNSDAASSGVTKLCVVLPLMTLPDCRYGVMAARQYPGRRS